jgi:outer membrane murein-binding lipoprotein Lpp
MRDSKLPVRESNFPLVGLAVAVLSVSALGQSPAETQDLSAAIQDLRAQVQELRTSVAEMRSEAKSSQRFGKMAHPKTPRRPQRKPLTPNA